VFIEKNEVILILELEENKVKHLKKGIKNNYSKNIAKKQKIYIINNIDFLFF
jgi:hypothetical protein